MILITIFLLNAIYISTFFIHIIIFIQKKTSKIYVKSIYLFEVYHI